MEPHFLRLTVTPVSLQAKINSMKWFTGGPPLWCHWRLRLFYPRAQQPADSHGFNGGGQSILPKYERLNHKYVLVYADNLRKAVRTQQFFLGQELDWPGGRLTSLLTLGTLCKFFESCAKLKKIKSCLWKVVANAHTVTQQGIYPAGPPL